MDPRYLDFISNHYVMVLGLATVTFLLIKEFSEAALSKYKNLSPMNTVAKINEGNLVIIDVREPHEFILGHIEAAINVPLAKIKDQLKTLEKHKNKEILVVCQSGTRAVPACNTLINAGFEKIFNLEGGMQAWEDHKFPVKITSKRK
jgi:rhodanese-related sulfurtransferase